MEWLFPAILFFLFRRRKTAEAEQSKVDKTQKTGPKSGGAKSTGAAAWKNGSRASPPTVMFMTNQLDDWWSSYTKFKRIWDASAPESFIPIVPDTWGTDETKMLNALKSLNENERKYLCRGYPWWWWDADDDWWRNSGHSLVWKIEDELEDEADQIAAKKSLPCLQW